MSVHSTVDTELGGGPRSPYVRDGAEIEVGGERFTVTVPAGLALVDLAAHRMARRLHDAAANVHALMAPAVVPAAGSSGRTDVEHRLQGPERPLRRFASGGPEGCSV